MHGRETAKVTAAIALLPPLPSPGRERRRFGSVWTRGAGTGRSTVRQAAWETTVMAKRYWARQWGEFPRAEYMAWHSLIRRCCDPRSQDFARYGGRGIRVCERWRDDFMAFLADMGPRPSPANSTAPRDNDGGYEPANCRWATRSQQQRNMRRVHRAVGASYVPRVDRWKAQI